MTLDLGAAERAIRRGRIIGLIALAGLALLFVLALRFTPAERVQGMVQKVVYLHAPAGWGMLMAFFIVGVVSILFLWLRDERLDLFAQSSAEVGLFFGALLLTTGPIYGAGAWGKWWDWEPRLTFTLIEVLLFCGYFALRSAIRDPAERARFAAVIGIMGMLLVPFIHLTVYLFNGLHPQPVVLRPSRPEMPSAMLRVFPAGMIVFTVMYVGFVMQRYGIAVRDALREAVDA